MSDLPVWVYFERDPQLGGIWVAHVLDFDLVTQAESLRDAIDMALDATIGFLAESLRRSPERFVEQRSSRRAPDEYWDKLWGLFQKAPAQPMDSIVGAEENFSAMGTQLLVSAAAVFHRMEHGDDDDDEPESPLSMPVGAVRQCA
jgi:hypothetical protein